MGDQITCGSINPQVTTNGESLSTHQEIPEAALPFTQSQLSVALSIQKSKPPELTTREYCLRLCKHIKYGESTDKNEHRYIDTVEFWKDQYSMLHQEKKAIEFQLTQLKQSGGQSPDSTAAISDNHDPFYTDRNNSARKRKVPVKDDLDLDETIPPSSLITIGKPLTLHSLPLLEQSHILFRLVQDDGVLSDSLLNAILSTITHMNSAIGQAFEIAMDVTSHTNIFYVETSTHLLKIVPSMFKMCLRGLAHLCRDIPGRRCKGQVIYALIQFFTRALDLVHELSVQQTSSVSAIGRGCRAQACPDTECRHIHMPSALIKDLSKMLATTLAAPQFQEPHTHYFEVLEGLFSMLLNRIGKLISMAVFGCNLASSQNPGRMASPGSSPPAPAITDPAVQLEGQTLASVLQYAVSSINDSGAGKVALILAGIKDLKTRSSKEVLMTKARRTLQQSLLKGAFGEDGHEFKEALKIPDSPPESIDKETPEVKVDQTVNFVETIWAIVGWEVLWT